MLSALSRVPVLVVSSLVLGGLAALLIAAPATQAGGGAQVPALYGP